DRGVELETRPEREEAPRLTGARGYRLEPEARAAEARSDAFFLVPAVGARLERRAVDERLARRERGDPGRTARRLGLERRLRALARDELCAGTDGGASSGAEGFLRERARARRELDVDRLRVRSDRSGRGVGALGRDFGRGGPGSRGGRGLGLLGRGGLGLLARG